MQTNTQTWSAWAWSFFFLHWNANFENLKKGGKTNILPLAQMYSSLSRKRHNMTNKPLYQHSFSSFWTFFAACLFCHCRIVPAWLQAATRVCVDCLHFYTPPVVLPSEEAWTPHPTLTEKTGNIQPNQRLQPLTSFFQMWERFQSVLAFRQQKQPQLHRFFCLCLYSGIDTALR